MVHKGGGGSKMSKNWSTWFKDAPLVTPAEESEELISQELYGDYQPKEKERGF